MVRGLRGMAAVVCASALMMVSACGTSISVTTRGQAEGPVLQVGVAADEPSMGWVHNDTYQGFDVDVASYVSRVLGYGDEQIEYVTSTPANAVQQVVDGTVQMAVVTLPMDGGDTSDEVAFAGPYLTVEDGVMVRTESQAPTSLDDLAGHTVCVVRGSGTDQLLKQAVADVQVTEQTSYADCVSSLLTAESDAVAGGEPVLYGLVKQTGSQYVHMLDGTFGTQQYGIAVKKDQSTLVEQLNAALRQMEQDGTWSSAVSSMQSFAGYRKGERLEPPSLS